MVIKNISDFRPRKKYIIYQPHMNIIGTYRYFRTILTEDEIKKLIADEKIAEFS